MAGPTGRKLINTPIKIRPPSIPKIEDKNAVAKVEIKIRNEIKTICTFYLKRRFQYPKISYSVNTLSEISLKALHQRLCERFLNFSPRKYYKSNSL